MLAEAVLRLGGRVRAFDPDPAAPALRQVVDVVTAAWHDRAALARFAAGCDVLTCDAEHVPIAALCDAPWAARFRPSLAAVAAVCSRAARCSSA
jgi:5-(carboxyamino)imidazole ribonucleotide synthase